MYKKLVIKNMILKLSKKKLKERVKLLRKNLKEQIKIKEKVHIQWDPDFPYKQIIIMIKLIGVYVIYESKKPLDLWVVEIKV